MQKVLTWAGYRVWIGIMVVMMAAMVPGFGQVGASSELVIDDFVSGTATIGPACHSVGYSSHSDPSILGGKRQIVVVDGHSCVTGNSPRASYFASSGTAEWWGKSVGSSAVAQYLAYGTAIGNFSRPWAVNPELANNPQTPLNLSLTTAHAILLDMGRVDPDTPFIRIELFAGNGQRFAASFTIAAGVNSLPLSGFTGLTDAVAADIDGIEFSGQAGGASITLGNGHIFNKIAVLGTSDTTPPVVTAPAPLTVECNTTGGVSTSDPAIQAWLASASATDNIDGSLAVSNDLALGLCAVGTTRTVTFSATDAAGNKGSATSTITVVDTVAPSISSASASKNVLWPANHKMQPVAIAVNASDLCDPSVSCVITSVSSNEPENGLGDGDTAPDWVVTGALTVELRAERSGTGTGRVYTITVTCTDHSGNASTKTVQVTVPHSMGNGQ